MGEKFYGIRKSDGSDSNIAYLVEGVYDGLDNVLTIPAGTDASRNFGAWTDNADPAVRETPTNLAVRFRATKQVNSQLIDMAITVKHGTSISERTIRDFQLPGGALDYELVMFRQNKRQTFKVKTMALSLCGCNDPIASNQLQDCNTPL